MVIGPDNNLWILENNSYPNQTCCVPQYVAIAVINSAVVNPAGGGMIQPGPGVFAEYTLASKPGGNGYASVPLKTIVSLGGFLWVMDKRGDLYRMNPTTGLVSPNLATGYGPGTTPTNATNGANLVTDPTGATQIDTDEAILAPMVVLGSSIYVPNINQDQVDLLALDMSATPSTGICSPAGASPCIATFTAPFTGLTDPKAGATTDGTNIYVLNYSSGSVYKLTPPSTIVSSTAVFPNTYEGGLAITERWLVLDAAKRRRFGDRGNVLGEHAQRQQRELSNQRNPPTRGQRIARRSHGTLLFSPNLTRTSGPTVAPLCAVVY